MSNGNDGYGEVGGNGSVSWVFDVSNLIGQSMKGKGPKGAGPGHRTEVVADNGAYSEFTVSVKLSKNLSEGELRRRLKDASEAKLVGNKLVFKIPIEQGVPDQIRISWGPESAT